MKKALIVSTVSRQFTLFERGNIAILKELGYEVHCAANYCDATEALDELGIVRHHIDIQRSPFSPKQIKAFFQLKSLMKEKEFDLVHCHAPMGGVIGRICAKVTNTSNVLYTAHGFHFYKGAPLINNIVYKTIERTMARWTDVIITINDEDYNEAKKFICKKDSKIYKIPGVGVDVNYIKKLQIDRNILRLSLGFGSDDFILISVGELNNNKNHKEVIKAITLLPNNVKDNIKYIVCGRGNNYDKLTKLIKHNMLENNVRLLGYRRDIIELLKISDVFVFPSKREGLSKSIMEAMAAGLPIIASKIRGNVDLVKDNENGYIFDVEDSIKLSGNIKELYENYKLREKFKEKNEVLSENYSIKIVNSIMREIYKNKS